MVRKTQIIATIGPATLDFAIFSKMVDEGIDIVRINTSYGDPLQYDKILENIEKIEEKKRPKVLYDIKDERKLDYFLKKNLDILAVSFAETAEQIQNYRGKAPHAFIIAKIESEKGVSNIDILISQVDGIMIARGDLSEAETIEKIPPLEKYLAGKAVHQKKFLITATEMMLSMVEKPKPEIAEVSDVANAVFDGSSAVMLSEETAIGRYPIEAVSYMRRTIEEAEAWLESKKSPLG